MQLTVPHYTYMAASDGEDAIWVQMLMVVILAAAGGIYAFVKSRPVQHKNKTGLLSIYHNIFNRGKEGLSHLVNTSQTQISVNRPVLVQSTASYQLINKTTSLAEPVSNFTTKKRDLKSGMELLKSSFLVKVIESRRDGVSADDLDVEMQKMCFAEMKRRNELEAVSSEALKTYTVDKAGRYGKTIQRQAMEELWRRTGRGSL